MVNVRVRDRLDPASSPGIRAAVTQVEQTLGANGRVVLRASGTEPVIRVMVEGRDRDQVDRLANQLADAVREAI